MYNFANKVVEWRAKNGFVGSNSRTSTDRPDVNVNKCKKKNVCKSVIINTGHLKQHEWEKVSMKCDVGCCNLIHYSMNNGLNEVFC